MSDAERAGEAPRLARTIESLLFLSTDPLSTAELADATQTGEGAVATALALLAERHSPGQSGIALRELGGGWTLPQTPSPRRPRGDLFSRPRVSTLTPAQAETLAIVAYMQPVSRPEIARIRGVSADSAVATLLDRGLIEEAGHSQFGAVVYRTTTQFLKLFGLRTLQRAARRRALGPDARGAGRAARAAAAGRRGSRGGRLTRGSRRGGREGLPCACACRWGCGGVPCSGRRSDRIYGRKYNGYRRRFCGLPTPRRVNTMAIRHARRRRAGRTRRRCRARA